MSMRQGGTEDEWRQMTDRPTLLGTVVMVVGNNGSEGLKGSSATAQVAPSGEGWGGPEKESFSGWLPPVR